VVVSSAPNTFTAAQTFASLLKINNATGPIFQFENIAPAGHRAGALLFYGDNGLGPSNEAW